jgi:putative phage-type endonuclease
MFHNVEQNSEEWYNLRAGKFTASSIKALFSKKSTDTYKNAISKIAIERVLGRRPEDAGISTQYMERGHELEPEAIALYEEQTFSECSNGGFFELNEWVGASPDAIIEGKNAGLEVKCPAFNTMIGYSLDSEKLKKAYYKQVQAQMFVCGFDYVDLVAHHPDFKLVIVRVEKDQELINEMVGNITEAKVKVSEMVEKLEGCIG